MDLLPLGFILAIAIASGFIGWAADRLGKKLGKKRLSFLGLRPRHTATLGTILLGVFVSLTSIGLITAVSKDAREWITRGAHALKDLQTTQQHLNEEQMSLYRAQLDEQAEKDEIGKLHSQIKAGAKTIADQNDQVTQLHTRIGSLESVQQGLQTTVKTTEEQIHAKDAQIKKAESQLTASESLVSENQKKIVAVRGQLGKVNSSLETSKADVAKYEALDTQLKAQVDVQQKKVDELQTQRTSLESELESSRQDLANVRIDLQTVTEKLSEQKVAFEQLKTNAKGALSSFFDDYFVPSRYGRLIYGIGQEVSREQLPAHLNHDQAEQSLDAFLSRVREEAGGRGAQAHGKYQVADLYDRPDGTTAKQLKDLLVDHLTDKPNDQVVIASSSMNAFQSEPVALEITIRENPIVYEKGNLVAQATLDGNTSEDQILHELTNFMDVQLRAKALQDKMIPRASEDEAFGSISLDRVLNLVHEVKQKGRKVNFMAIAAAETRAADTLRLDYRIQ